MPRKQTPKTHKRPTGKTRQSDASVHPGMPRWQMRTMIDYALELFPKVAYSTILIFLCVIFISELWRVWADTRLYLAPFGYERDGTLQSEAGLNFSRRVSQSLRRVSFIYSGGGAADISIASTDQIEKARNLELPNVRTSDLESVEVQAYGINFGSILRTVRGWVHARNEIVGFVSHHGTDIDVQASIQGQFAGKSDSALGTGLNLGWAIKETDLEKASQGIACGIFRTLAAEQSEPFRTIRDQDFCQFLSALETYQEYRIALPRNVPQADKEKILETAATLIMPLEGTRFPYASKLAGLIYREKGDLTKAQEALQSYLDTMNDFGLRDTEIETDLASMLANTVSAIAAKPPPPAPLGEFNGKARVRPLTVGVSISSTTTSAGTLCCFVRDTAGKAYALTADHNVAGALGDLVLQPGALDGGKSPDDAIGKVTRILSGADTNGMMAGALIELTPSGRPLFDPTIPGSNGAKIGKLASDVAIGENIYAVGRTSGIIRGTVNGINMTVALSTGPKTTERYNGLISSSRISTGGDSGAPVFNSKNELIGMVYAGGADITFIMPIKPIIEALSVSLAAN